jgi:hypothetical protein
MDDETTLNDLKSDINAFCEARDWDQFHDALHLAVGASTEASELLDIFRFRQPNQFDFNIRRLIAGVVSCLSEISLVP